MADDDGNEFTEVAQYTFLGFLVLGLVLCVAAAFVRVKDYRAGNSEAFNFFGPTVPISAY